MPHQVMDYPTPRRPSELCSITFLRYALFGFNTILLLTGLVLMGVGVTTLMDKGDFFFSVLVSPYYSMAVYGTVAIASLVLIASILGCQGTIQEVRCSLIVFSFLMVFILLGEVAVGVFGYLVHSSVTHQNFSMDLSKVMVGKWKIDPVTTQAVDNLQLKYSCCGAENHTEWLRNEDILRRNVTTPDSCCKTVTENCGSINHASNLWNYQNDKGCSEYLKKDIALYVLLIPAVSLGFSILQIFGIIFSCALAHAISLSKRRARQKWTYY